MAEKRAFGPIFGTKWRIFAQPMPVLLLLSCLLAGTLSARALTSPTQTEQLQTLLDHATGRTVTLPPGRFTLVAPLVLRATHCRITSAGSTTLTGALPVLVQAGSDWTDVTIDRLTFVSTGTSAATGYYGLLTTNQFSLSKVRISRCVFSAPGISTNGVKIILDKPGCTARNVTLDGCRFVGLGRMGVEVQNHLDDTERFARITVSHCQFRDLGLIRSVENDHWGIAVSISGAGRDVRVQHNVIENPYSIGIEVTGGVPLTRITDNLLRRCDRFDAENNRPLSLISLESGKRPRTAIGCLVARNRCPDIDPNTSVFFGNVQASVIQHNLFPVRTWVYLRDCSANRFVGNRIISRGLYGLLIESSAGKTSTNNAFVNDTITCQPTGELYAVIGMNGPGVTRNTLTNSVLNKPAGRAATLNLSQTNRSVGNVIK
jgi:Right handed beta helix region